MSRWDTLHPSYVTWKAMMANCGLKGSRSERAARLYEGISVCDEWLDFYAFEEWICAQGWRHRIDAVVRVDKSKDFSPENCRVMPRTEIEDYRRNVTRINGVSVRKILGLPPGRTRQARNASQRIRVYGWPVHEALARPVTPHNLITKINLKRKEHS